MPSAIIYGADWCNPCHLAEEHLKKRGVIVSHRDIEADPLARAEMMAKQAQAGKLENTIPVIDLDGKIFVGFNAQALDQALGIKGGIGPGQTTFTAAELMQSANVSWLIVGGIVLWALASMSKKKRR